jgi:hypothetical protein
MAKKTRRAAPKTPALPDPSTVRLKMTLPSEEYGVNHRDFVASTEEGAAFRILDRLPSEQAKEILEKCKLPCGGGVGFFATEENVRRVMKGLPAIVPPRDEPEDPFGDQ